MNTVERIKMVKAMEYIMRQVNDENVFESWLVYGVADGDIEYGDLVINEYDDEYMKYYIKDDSFSEMMGLFLRCMARANKSGGLWCNDVLSEQ